MPKKIFLLTLQTFSSTGGIQKMTRTLAHSLQQVALHNKFKFKLWSVYDNDSDLMPHYVSPGNFKGFNANRGKFGVSTLKMAVTADVIIISHINLAIIGLGIKIINPKCKVWLIAHGIEVWRPLSFIKNYFLKKCNQIICVSNFTQQEMIKRHKINAEKCAVLNNAVDPFMVLPKSFEKPKHLLERYQLTINHVILYTLTRLAATEQYKGYEQVIKVISKLKDTVPSIKYILSGKYDDMEERRIKQLIGDYKVEDQIILTGFINENELTDHFLLADLFVLPSKKEGFGIVFIEALACGLPVICGNVDGSLDAIKNGELGRAINPDDLMELENTLATCLNSSLTIAERKNLQKQCLHYFNEGDYIIKLQHLLNNEPIN
ncbi:glycosyltransferase family 4 protein [Mucilaginibacter sp.]|uniref:glycosyltransferase family 4 protein n=1 Tax=Mucilaginibacter sp. TaxID=1882438 RepID=UPI002637C5C8|nr:glycosyltransferase family 4 protein [Mucilaginibacter sp.]MDB4927027.1 glycosyltransferase [Mucilaginibacter sp.]